jgi:hypothetical protein
MCKLEDFYVGRVIKIEVENKRLKKYGNFGMTLVNYSGEDQINNNEMHAIINGNLSPRELQNFEIIMQGNTITYLYEMERFDLFLERNKPITGINLFYIESLLNAGDIDLEVVISAFKIIVSNKYEKGPIKKLHSVRK